MWFQACPTMTNYFQTYFDGTIADTTTLHRRDFYDKNVLEIVLLIECIGKSLTI